MKKKKKRKKSQSISKPRLLLAVLAVVCILASVGIALYPTVSDYYYSLVHKHTISDYSSEVDQMEDGKIDKMLVAARKYNEKLLESGKRPTDPLDDKELKKYNKLLDIYGGGVMGYIRIQKIGVFLPIYHGADEDNLQVGAGHLPSSSLPVGGEGTHSVIMGHSGLRSAVMFTDLDHLKEGDTFTITVLKEVLTYEVDQIKVVLPNELDALTIEPGMDYCTLVTCTPYGVNTHRLLVRGRRVNTVEQTDQGEQIEQDPAQLIQNFVSDEPDTHEILQLIGVFIIAAVAACVSAVYMIWKRHSQRKRR